MGKVFIMIACFASCVSMYAQAKVQEVVSDKYDRSGLSVIVVTRGDNFDSPSINYAEKLVIHEKFDANMISLKTVNIRKDRKVAITQAEADSLIKSADVAKKVVGYIFNRKADGTMDDQLIRYRGMYNAKDQDIINAAASKVNEQSLEWGEKLVSSSYVVLLDFVNIHHPKTKDKKGNEVEEKYYACETFAFAYKVDFDKEKLDDFYANAWADESYSAADKAKAVDGFNAMEINMAPAASVSAAGASLNSVMSGIGSSIKGVGSAFKGLASSFSKTGNKEDAVDSTVVSEPEIPVWDPNSVEFAENSGFDGVMFKLENKISEWQVAVSIASVKPLKAKIGKKEGLTNGQRFRSYSYTEDEDGNLVSKPRGYLRATKIVDNRGIATGASESSEFWQISGGKNIEEGWTIKQKNDIKLGVALTGKYGGVGTIDAGVDLDYLIHFSKVGSFYAMLNVGTDVMQYGIKLDNTGFTNLNYSAGIGYGLHAGRVIEITPYAMVGMDMMQLNNEVKFAYLTDEQNKRTGAFFLEPGLRIAFQIAYPCSLFLKGGYDLLLSKSDDLTHYNFINQSLPENRRHKSGVFGEFGIRWAF